MPALVVYLFVIMDERGGSVCADCPFCCSHLLAGLSQAAKEGEPDCLCASLSAIWVQHKGQGCRRRQ